MSVDKAVAEVLRDVHRLPTVQGSQFVGAVSLSGSRSAGVDAVANLANVSGKVAASYTAASSVQR